jgi:MOSC domain-containing protein YiiM
MDDLRPGLPKEIRGRRGMLCRIVKGGIIRQGDAIEKLLA